MFSIVLDVPVVINDIDAAGDEGESDETVRDHQQLIEIQ
jgi:hypothetical protein